MKSFTALALAGFAAAQSTGHFGDAFAHKGTKDHSPQDHNYGYDSVPVDYDIVEADNITLSNAIKTQVIAANDARINYLIKVYNKRIQRMTEIHSDNLTKISSPFTYQTRLLREEESDILQAQNNAVRDANDAFDDLIFRLESFKDDIAQSFTDEVVLVKDAISRSAIDRKNPCAVLFAMRLDWAEMVTNCVVTRTPFVYAANIASDVTNSADVWKQYNTVFSDFHYDIGHGKGSGSGAIDAAPVTDGFRSGSLQMGAMGDSQVQFGAPTIAFERPGRSNRRRF